MTTRSQRWNAYIKASEEQKEELDTLLNGRKMSAFNRLVLKIIGVANAV